MINPDFKPETMKKPKIYLKFALYFLPITICILFIVTLVSYYIVSTSLDNLSKLSINNVDVTPTLICDVLDCNSFTYLDQDDHIYKIFLKNRETDKLSLIKFGPLSSYDEKDYMFHVGPIASNLDLILQVTDGTIVINSSMFASVLTRLYIYFNVVIFIPYVIAFTVIYILNARNNMLKKGEFKSELETRLQRNLTEMLHHELGAPLALIDSNLEELKTMTIPCVKKHSMLCIKLANNNNNKNNNEFDTTVCEKCTKFKSAKYNDMLETYNNIDFGIERIKAILKIISSAKHIRFSNGTVPLYQIVDNVVSSVNSFKLSKITLTVYNEYLLKEYSVLSNNDLNNGSMTNILHVLINNAIEAYATRLKIKVNGLDVNNNGDYSKLELLIQDNGSGILNSKGEIIKTNKIFDYGFSLKDMSNGPRHPILKKLADIFGFNVIGENNSTRGIGLFISKATLEKAGGKLELYDTTKTGTTFRMVIPVKPTIYAENKKK